ncbi:NupC/NupG family nucleoside CNT transporter [Planctomycetota bacterium]
MSGMSIHNLHSTFGLFAILALAWGLSCHRRVINIRLIVIGLCMQLLLGFFIFRMQSGIVAFQFVNQAVVAVLDSAGAGARFLFGPLALGPGQTDDIGQSSVGFILAFQAFPTIIFFSALIAILYRLGVMVWVVRGFAYLFARCLRTSGAESLAAASNIFVGIESTLTVKPYLARMTRSELCTVLTAGMATVASNVLALYVLTLQETFPQIAGHLVSASLLSAPAALVMAKLLYPEVETPETLDQYVTPYYEREDSYFEAIINGANSGVRMIVGISALLIAVISLVALVDLVLNGVGSHVNLLFGMEGSWSLKGISGYLFYPLVLLLGVSPPDLGTAAEIIGERLVVTEVVAYQDLAVALKSGALQDGRSAVIITYALCGFAHLASMAIFVGGACALVPERKRDLTAVAWRALAAATLACLSTACIAGIYTTSGRSLLLLSEMP